MSKPNSKHSHVTAKLQPDFDVSNTQPSCILKWLWLQAGDAKHRTLHTWIHYTKKYCNRKAYLANPNPRESNQTLSHAAVPRGNSPSYSSEFDGENLFGCQIESQFLRCTVPLTWSRVMQQRIMSRLLDDSVQVRANSALVHSR